MLQVAQGSVQESSGEWYYRYVIEFYVMNKFISTAGYNIS